MNSTDEYVLALIRSSDDKAAFYACMGRFFASATVRRECGGYPLNDGPRYYWFVVRRKDDARVLGFISLEKLVDVVRLREGYVRPEARGRGLFSLLRREALQYIDTLGLPCSVRVTRSCAPYLLPYGFVWVSTRGNWATLKRSAHAHAE